MNTEGEKRAQLLQTILETSPNCVYVKDKQGRYIIANKTIADLYQTTPDEMIGKKDEDFADQAILKPNEAAFFKDIDKKAIETKETQIIPCESFTYDDGSTHYFFTTKTPITYDGDSDCVMGISVDITKLKEAEKQVFESKNKFQNILICCKHHQPSMKRMVITLWGCFLQVGVK
jgi:PAS domain S-box-containing protein